MTPQEKAISIALAEVGYREKKTNAFLDSPTQNAGSNNWTKYARDLDGVGKIYNGPKNGYDWCDVFVDWVYYQAFGLDLMMKITGQQYYGVGAGCKFSLNYYKQIGRYFNKGETTPMPADQIFYTSRGMIAHTGLVIHSDGKNVYTVEGNTGEMVKRMTRSLNDSYVLGFGRPLWNLIPTEEEKEVTEPVTHEEWMEHYNQFRKDLQEKDGSDWSAPYRKIATEIALFEGGDDGMFMWQDFLTREQAATLIIRLLKALGKLVTD